MFNDTICAVATALSDSGICIIRVSGNDAIKIVDPLFVNPSKKHILSSIESHTISYGFLLNGEETVDEVLVSYFKGPRSFTAEDTVEINCHGGVFVTNKILQILVKNGARLAEPGEFTKRAFLNGRIDLSKAEAVMDIISSETDISLKSSVSQLKGSVYNKIKDFRNKIIYEIAFIESALDDPEHISLEGYPEKLKNNVLILLKEIYDLSSSFEEGRIIKNGIKTVILGKPNSGKSSLLNKLSGFDSAIVTNIPGTTRDAIHENIKIGDIHLSLTDTAGIRNTDDIVEKIGVERAFSYAEDADLIIYMVDASVPLDDSDEKIISYIKNKKSIVLFNKSDLSSVIDKSYIEKKLENIRIIETSMVDDKGISEFKNIIEQMFLSNDISLNNEIIITNIRHKEALDNAYNSLRQVIMSIENDMPEDFYSIDLMSAYAFLGNIIGEEVSEDLVNEIFSKFCMGK